MSNPFLKKKPSPPEALAVAHAIVAPDDVPLPERSHERPKRSQELEELKARIQQLEAQMTRLLTVTPPKQFLNMEKLLLRLQNDPSATETVTYLRKKLIEDGEEPLKSGRYKAWLVARKIVLCLFDYENSR